MSITDQQKLIKAGFTIIRKQDDPTPRIKASTGSGWAVLQTYKTKKERDKAFSNLLKDEMIITD